MLTLLILIVGELVLDLNSKSLANSISLNISLIFPATVISLIGQAISPFYIINPEPPLIQSPVTLLNPEPNNSVM